MYQNKTIPRMMIPQISIVLDDLWKRLSKRFLRRICVAKQHFPLQIRAHKYLHNIGVRCHDLTLL
jgi:hypothetical protein